VLDAARPTAVNLSWATRASWTGLGLVLPNVDDLRSAIIAEAQRIADEDVEINRRMGAFGADIIPHEANILTHCNAGALATVDYGTTLGVVRSRPSRARTSTSGSTRRGRACRARGSPPGSSCRTRSP
jgi:methylthioribose-1-phosphate isomerase